MIGPRALLLLFAVVLFITLAAAAPIPNEAALAKKSLKQFKLKRGDNPSRVGRAAAVPSGYVAKRDAATAPKPSQVYRRT
ncbi:hypothetical protein C8F04DRAFT_1073387 [Mycena alexandri]|uniref:Uncharacterized protein n=1 Tax=Mycena alexandri TaxID=1745969 RepID=A0AAD6TB61_9AGAR|nr:hypothetical protein C8F04DRAFT_117487 [Mycena alexandri]KAJ7043018.1 hypothetical protein C8F04DRAFT_1073387 [Mycena alexandri]